MSLRLCLHYAVREKNRGLLDLVRQTLDQLGRGGIYDQLGGGFHRYSTDDRWLVPHFEKMLYDNALLAELYLEAYQATRQVELAQVARETLDYTLREMTSPEGGFYSTQDADSEGVEGKFYVWTREEIFRLLDKDSAEPFCRIFDVTAEGNWEGHCILNRTHSPDSPIPGSENEQSWLEDSLAAAKRKLFAARGKRVAPFRDEKILVAWNGMMIESLAKAYQLLSDERYLNAARAAADFILEKMIAPDGKKLLLHVYKDGRARLTAYLDDYATLINGLVSLYESDFQPRWLTQAVALTTTMLDQFWDPAQPGFFLTGKDHEPLITRPKDHHDGATPSGAGMAIQALIRLGQLTGKTEWLDRANRALQELESTMRQIPTGASQFLLDLDWLQKNPSEIVLIGGESAEENEAALRLLREHFLPNRVIAYAADTEVISLAAQIPLLVGRRAVGGKATLYVCQNFTCDSPLVGLAAIEAAWGAR
jgi:uncharacterized protein YyaL (SSP411 family)